MAVSGDGAARTRSGVSSMNRVVDAPDANAGCVMTRSRKVRFDATPWMRVSRSARAMRRIASPGEAPRVVIFMRRES